MSTTPPEEPKPFLRRWPVIVALCALAVGLLNYLTTHRQLFTSEVKFSGFRTELKLNEQDILTVKVNDEDAAVGQYECKWTVDGQAPRDEVGGGIAADNCAHRTVRNFGSILGSAKTATLTIEVTVWRRSGASTTLLGSAQYKIVLRNEVDPEIDVEPSTIYLNQATRLGASIRGQNLPTGYTCIWTVNGVRQPPQTPDGGDCFAYTYRADNDMQEPEQKSVLVELSVKSRSDILVGTKTAYLTIRRPLGFFSIYAIDTTERMLGLSGSGLKDALIHVRKHIENSELLAVQVGIKTFGRAADRSNRSECGVIDTLYKLQPLNIADATKVLDGIVINGFNARLFDAIESAVQDFKALLGHPTARFSLIVITGGPNVCPPSTTRQQLEAVETLLRNSPAGKIFIDFKMLTLNLRLVATKDEARRIMREADAYQRGDIRGANIELAIADASVLNEVLYAVVRLSSSNSGDRASACQALRQVFGREGGEWTSERLQLFCNKLTQ